MHIVYAIIMCTFYEVEPQQAVEKEHMRQVQVQHLFSFSFFDLMLLHKLKWHPKCTCNHGFLHYTLELFIFFSLFP